MPLAEGQVQIRDLVMGPGTPYRIMTEFNPFNRSVRADQSGPRAWNHGAWSGVEWAAEATVPMRILVEADDVAGWISLHQQLMAAFAPVGESATDVELRFAMGGREYMMRGRPRMVEPDLKLIGTGKSFTQAAFVALDPFIYSGTEGVAGPLHLPRYEGGLVISSAEPLNSNTGFEENLDGWFVSGVGVTLTRSDAQAHSGSWSALMTPSGSAATAEAGLMAPTAPVVTPGVEYTWSVWVYSPVGDNVTLVMSWRDASNNLIVNENSGQIPVPANEWTQLVFTRTAPENAARCSARIWLQGTPAPTDLLFIDDAEFVESGAGGLTLPFTIPAVRVGGTAGVQNEGTAETGMFLRIDGPVDQPIVSLRYDTGTTQTLRFNLSVGDGQWLEVDTAARSVLLNGQISQRGRVAGDWPTLPPGSHTLRWQATSGTGTLTVRWRSAWW